MILHDATVGFALVASVVMLPAKVKERFEGGSDSRVQVCSVLLLQAYPYTSIEPIVKFLGSDVEFISHFDTLETVYAGRRLGSHS